MSDTRGRVPPHLRRFVAVHEPRAYDAIDQSVWRFILGRIEGALGDAAPPAYPAGLAATGIAHDRIPGIDAIDRQLGEHAGEHG